MRIAIVHSYYAAGQPSGENSIVDLSTQVLSDAGHDVRVFGRRTDDLAQGRLYKALSGLNVMTGQGASPSSELRDFAPDVVHVHNLFPNFGTSWLCEWRHRLVSTVHNFRSVCANGLLFRDGAVCMDCPQGSSLSAVRHACYRGSRAATVPLAVRNRKGLSHDPVFTYSSRVITLSVVARELFLRFGGPADRLVVLPNGVPVDAPAPSAKGNGRWLVVGRLSAEKGIARLVRDWPPHASLDIMGDGPEEQEIRSQSKAAVRLLGQLPRSEVLARMSAYEGLVFPSLCLEMQPTVVIEAMSAGLPVVALSGNAGADLVSRHRAGGIYSGAEDLGTCLAGVIRDRAAMLTAGQQAYRLNYAPDRWLTSIEGLYTRVAEEASMNGVS